MTEILNAKVQDPWLIIRVKKFSHMPYPLATIHPLQADDGRQLMPIGRLLLKYG